MVKFMAARQWSGPLGIWKQKAGDGDCLLFSVLLTWAPSPWDVLLTFRVSLPVSGLPRNTTTDTLRRFYSHFKSRQADNEDESSLPKKAL